MSKPRRDGQLSWPEIALYGGITAYGWAQFWTFAIAPVAHIWLWYPAGHAAGTLMVGVGCMQLSLSRLLRERKIGSAKRSHVRFAQLTVEQAAKAAQLEAPKVVFLNERQATVSATRILKTGSIEITRGALECVSNKQLRALVTRELVAYQRADARKFYGSMPSSWLQSGFRAQVLADRLLFGLPFDWPAFVGLSAAIIGAKRLRNGWMRNVQAETDMAAVDLLRDGEALASGLERIAKHNEEVAPWNIRLTRFLLAQNSFIQRLRSAVWQWDIPVAQRAKQIRERGTANQGLDEDAA